MGPPTLVDGDWIKLSGLQGASRCRLQWPPTLIDGDLDPQVGSGSSSTRFNATADSHRRNAADLDPVDRAAGASMGPPTLVDGDFRGAGYARGRQAGASMGPPNFQQLSPSMHRYIASRGTCDDLSESDMWALFSCHVASTLHEDGEALWPDGPRCSPRYTDWGRASTGGDMHQRTPRRRACDLDQVCPDPRSSSDRASSTSLARRLRSPGLSMMRCLSCFSPRRHSAR
jgi:hypothetical protein